MSRIFPVVSRKDPEFWAYIHKPLPDIAFLSLNQIHSILLRLCYYEILFHPTDQKNQQFIPMQSHSKGLKMSFTPSPFGRKGVRNIKCNLHLPHNSGNGIRTTMNIFTINFTKKYRCHHRNESDVECLLIHFHLQNSSSILLHPNSDLWGWTDGSKMVVTSGEIENIASGKSYTVTADLRIVAEHCCGLVTVKLYTVISGWFKLIGKKCAFFYNGIANKPGVKVSLQVCYSNLWNNRQWLTSGNCTD